MDLNRRTLVTIVVVLAFIAVLGVMAHDNYNERNANHDVAEEQKEIAIIEQKEEWYPVMAEISETEYALPIHMTTLGTEVIETGVDYGSSAPYGFIIHFGPFYFDFAPIDAIF